FRRITAKDVFGFSVSVVGLEDARIGGPGHGFVPGLRRAFQQFKLDEIRAAVADGGSEAVVAGVAAADYYHLFPARVDPLAVGESRIEEALRVRGEIVHGEMYPGKVPAGNREIARAG